MISTDLSDNEFVDVCYRRLLQRPPDPRGLGDGVAALGGRLSRLEFIASLVSSPEYYTVLNRALFGAAELPDLSTLRLHNYHTAEATDSSVITVFEAHSLTDFDWLEQMIRQHGYYDRPGVWSLAMDPDKIMIAEMVQILSSGPVLEIGCSTGPVLKLLADKGFQADGVEISHMALALAYGDVRSRIYYGDVLEISLTPNYMIILGMDVFEHLNPRKIPRYLKRCYDLLLPGGLLLTNIPAFGHDPVFGEVFPIYCRDWLQSGIDANPFRSVHVDAKGWPLNGHLTWATAKWWQNAFEQVGFTREFEREWALHAKYDKGFERGSIARKSFFVFSKRNA
jgi:SAM-dependent methyltransferase